MRIKSTQDLTTGLLFIAIGLGAYLIAIDYPMGSARSPGTGVLPKTLAWLLGGTGVILIIKATLVAGPRLWIWAWRPVLMVTLGTIAFAGLIDQEGAVVPRAVSMIGWLELLRYLPGAQWLVFGIGPFLIIKAVAWLLAAIGAILIVKAALLSGPPSPAAEGRAALMISLATIAFALLINRMGIVVTMAVSMTLAALGTPETRWLEYLLFALFMIALGIVVFIYGLGMPIQIHPWKPV